MDLALLVYGINVLGKISIVLGLVIAFGTAIAGVSMMVRIFHARETWDSKADEQIKQGRRETSMTIFKYAGIAVIVSAVLNILLPSERTAYVMVGAYAAQKVAENDKVQQMSSKVLTVIEQKLDGYIQEGIKEAEDKVDKAKK